MMGEHVILSHHRESHLAVEPIQYYRCTFCVHLSQPVPWKFEGSPTQGLDEQPSDPIIERLRQNLASVSAGHCNFTAMKTPGKSPHESRAPGDIEL